MRQLSASDPSEINHGTEDSDADANLAIENSAAAFASLMQLFMTSVTDAIATTITNAYKNAENIDAAAATAVRTVPNSVASIDPFENLTMNMNTREGKALCYTITNIYGTWPKAGVVVTVANVEALQYLIRDKVALYGLERSMDIPTTRKGAVESAPKMFGGKDCANAKKGNLRLSNSFKSALCNQMMTS